MANNNSYELGAKSALQEAFETLVANEPRFISLVAIGSKATSTKEEWIEDYFSPTSTTITAVSGSGTGTTITVASATGIQVGEILSFETSAGIDREELVRVSAINGNDLTVIRNFGSYIASPATLVATDKVQSVSKPKNEGTTAVAGDGRMPSKNFNYTQIFDRTAMVSKTAQQMKYDGVGNLMGQQLKYKLQEIAYEMNNALIRGVRTERTASNEGTMGGVLSYLKGGNVVNGASSALSATMINDALQACFADGALSSRFVLLCNETQARRISKFNTTGSNPLVLRDSGDKTSGGYISTFVGDLPVKGGFTATVAVEPLFPKDKVALLDLSQLELAPLREFDTIDATVAGADYEARRIIGEYTLRVRNGKYGHALISNLTV